MWISQRTSDCSKWSDCRERCSPIFVTIVWRMTDASSFCTRPSLDPGKTLSASTDSTFLVLPNNISHWFALSFSSNTHDPFAYCSYFGADWFLVVPSSCIFSTIILWSVTLSIFAAQFDKFELFHLSRTRVSDNFNNSLPNCTRMISRFGITSFGSLFLLYQCDIHCRVYVELWIRESIIMHLLVFCFLNYLLEK